VGLKISVGMIDVQEGQRIEEGKSKLIEMGVNEQEICIDRVRGVGRGSVITSEDPVTALCGACAKSKCVITASGDVYPCVFSRSFNVGNVLSSKIDEIIYGPILTTTRLKLTEAFAGRSDKCGPIRHK
jgi:MoaA/NifB/PqqE/SkfB family radical SAM enzyme